MDKKEQMPKTIYLQHKSDDTYGEQTWCEDKINDDDVEYVLKTTVAEATKEKEEWFKDFVKEYGGFKDPVNGRELAFYLMNHTDFEKYKNDRGRV